MLKTPHLKYQPVYLYLRTLVLDPVPNFNTAPFGGAVDTCYLQVRITLFKPMLTIGLSIIYNKMITSITHKIIL